jgi:ribosomal protein S18 acetylase RimI-like enzyme
VKDTVVYLTAEERPVDIPGLQRLYAHTEWAPRRDAVGIEASLATSIAVGAWDGERLVGFTRALSDGTYRAYVEDVVVDPDYRGRGIGERMVAALLRTLADIETVSLFCEPARVGFYERNGFEARRNQVMMHKRRETRDVP